MTALSTLIIGTFDCNDRINSFLVKSDLGVPELSIDTFGGHGFSIRQGTPRIDDERTASFTVRLKAATPDALESLISALRSQIPGLGDASSVDAVVGLPGRSQTGILRVLRSPRPNVGVDVLYVSGEQAVVELTLACDPYVYGAAQQLTGSLITPASPAGSSWPRDFAAATYPADTAVLSLRFDDGTNADYHYTRAELKSRGLTAGFAIVVSDIDGVGYMAPEHIERLEADGNEIMCHSYTHGVDPANFAEFRHETVDALEALQAYGFTVVNWVQPGSWTGLWNIHSDTSTIDYPWEMGCPGDLLLREHFMAYEAYFQGTARALPVSGDYRYGVSHYSPDSYTGGTFPAKDRIDSMIAAGGGREFLFHSATIGGGGGISTADFESTLDYIAAKVASGDITVLLPTEQLYAVEAA